MGEVWCGHNCWGCASFVWCVRVICALGLPPFLMWEAKRIARLLFEVGVDRFFACLVRAGGGYVFRVACGIDRWP